MRCGAWLLLRQRQSEQPGGAAADVEALMGMGTKRVCVCVCGGGGNPMHRIWMMAIWWVAVKVLFNSGVHAGAGSTWILEHYYYYYYCVYLFI